MLPSHRPEKHASLKEHAASFGRRIPCQHSRPRHNVRKCTRLDLDKSPRVPEECDGMNHSVGGHCRHELVPLLPGCFKSLVSKSTASDADNKAKDGDHHYCSAVAG